MPTYAIVGNVWYDNCYTAVPAVPLVPNHTEQLRLQLEIWKKRAEQAEAALGSVLERITTADAAPAPHAPLLSAIERANRHPEFREPPRYLLVD